MVDNTLKKFIERFSIFTNANENGYDTAFELLSSVICFSLSPVYIIKNCWTGEIKNKKLVTTGQDGKIDGFYVLSNQDEIIIKIQQSKNTDGVKINDIELFFNSVQEYLIDLDKPLVDGYMGLNKVRNEIIDAIEKNPDAKISYELFLTCRSIKTNQKDSLTSIFNNKFSSRNFTFKIFDESKIIKEINKIKEDILTEKFNDTISNVKLCSKGQVIEHDFGPVLVSAINGEEIISLVNNEFFKNMELSRMFGGNVRGFLERTPINSDIKKTIEESPKLFIHKNNGIVVLCEKVEMQPNEISVVIKNPIIVNGQQTVSSIFRYANKENQSKIMVPVKFLEITKYKKKALLDIADASNKMNELDPLALLSNRSFFVFLKKYFSSNDIHFKIKDGEILNDVFLESDDAVLFIDILKVWLAVYLNRPSDSKKTAYNITQFKKAYEELDNNKKGQLRLLVEEDNFQKMAQMFLISEKINRVMPKIKEYFHLKQNTEYYDHAQYMIIYLWKEFFEGDFYEQDFSKFTFTDDQYNAIVSELEILHGIEKERKLKDKKEFTYNNYYKSLRPLVDYSNRESKQVGTFGANVERLLKI